MISSPPIRTKIQDTQSEKAITQKSWARWFNDVFTIVNAVSQFGTTAQRPTTQLYISRMFFDTTLGKPIWYNGTGWVDATGASV